MDADLILIDYTDGGNVRSLLQHNQARDARTLKPSILDVHENTCVHQDHPLAPMCGKVAVNSITVPHGWLCTDHLSRKVQ